MMKKADVQIGEVYSVKVSGRIAPVRIVSISPYGGWVGRNLKTKRTIHIRSARRLRLHISPFRRINPSEW